MALIFQVIFQKNKEKQSYTPKLEQLKSEIEALETQTQKQVQEIKQAQQDLFEEKESLVAKMDNKVISFYAKIRRWALNTSVVPVFKQACGGCFIKLNDTIYNEILKGNDIINCPHCGRILYADSQAKASAQESVKAEAKPKKKAKA